MSTTEERNYVKRVRERMRRRGWALAERARPLEKPDEGFKWWWVDVIAHGNSLGPYDSQLDACKIAERQGFASAGLGGGVA